MDLYFGDTKKIVCGNIQKYLLEKSRIVYQAEGERNYHVFFQLFHLPPAWRTPLKLTKAEDYHYLRQGGCTTVDGIDDAEELRLMKDAFTRLGIATEDMITLFTTVAAVLHLGNVRFNAADDEAVVLSDIEEVRLASDLLGLDAEQCGKALVTRQLKVGREITIANNNLRQAEDSRDGLGKALYSKIFDWITERINVGICDVKTGEKVNSIGVLDIFGFEIFKVNSFEQLCINLANEKLQYVLEVPVGVCSVDLPLAVASPQVSLQRPHLHAGTRDLSQRKLGRS